MALNTSVIVILLLSLLPRTNSQKLPSRDEGHFRFQISHAEIFHDTKHLPDGAEVTAYLYKDVAKKYFFIIEEDNTPVSITIKPCASSVHWKVSLYDLPDENSATGGSEDDQLMRQLKTKKRGQSKRTLLKEYTGHSVNSYVTSDSPPGIYVIEISALDSDASVKFYATTTPDSDQPYPELPVNAEVDVVRITRKSIQAAWKPSPSASLHAEPIEYCVSVNRKRNFYTRCDAVAHIVGEQPPTIPPNAGFGFAWENDQYEAMKREASPVVPIKAEEASFKCIGSKTSYTFTNLNYDTNYYLNVYAVNRSNNMSTAYNGTSARTKPSRKYVNLIDGKVRLQFLKRSRGYKLYRFALKKATRKVIFSIHPCSGFVHVELFQESHLINKANGRGLITFEVKSATAGTFYVKVYARRRRSVSYKIMATTRESAFPYPVMPKDSSIRVYDTLIKCDRITVVWLGTPKRQQYCLYRRVVDKKPKRHRLMLNSCHGPSLRKKSEKVACKTYRARNKRKTVISEMVTGLKPNTTYAFDLYVSKIRGETLSYKSVYARTLGRC